MIFNTKHLNRGVFLCSIIKKVSNIDVEITGGFEYISKKSHLKTVKRAEYNSNSHQKTT